jgi:hypothetical protein
MEPENVEQPLDLSGSLDEPVSVPNLESTSNDLGSNTELGANADLSNTTIETPEITEPAVDDSVTNVEANNETKEATQLPNKTELMNSLSNVVDYITDAVAEKVSLNVTSAQFGEKQQNGFDSVNAAAGIMAKSGGKRRKTRKFKLSKKNKTKKA